MNGSGSPSNVITGENGPEGVTIDAAANRMYWGNNGSSAIRRGELTLAEAGIAGESGMT